MMIGTELVARRRLHTSSPSSFGSMMSSTTRSGDSSPKRLSASSPSAAWITVKPSRSSGNDSTLRTDSSSSTSRMVESGMCVGESLGACRHAGRAPWPTGRGPDSYYSPAMAPPRVRPRQRRRHRHGSTERPVNGRLYRSAFLVVSLPLLLAALTVARPTPLQRPLLPPAFDEQTAAQLAEEHATRHPRRVPGSAGAVLAAQWFRDQLRPYGLSARSDV